MNTPSISAVRTLVAAYEGTALIPDILLLVGRAFGIAHADLMGRGRARHFARPRQIAMWLCRRCTPCSFPELGRVFGRDHTTVMHGVEQVERLMAAEPKFAAAVWGLAAQIDPDEVVA